MENKARVAVVVKLPALIVSVAKVLAPVTDMVPLLASVTVLNVRPPGAKVNEAESLQTIVLVPGVNVIPVDVVVQGVDEPSVIELAPSVTARVLVPAELNDPHEHVCPFVSMLPWAKVTVPVVVKPLVANCVVVVVPLLMVKFPIVLLAKL